MVNNWKFRCDPRWWNLLGRPTSRYTFRAEQRKKAEAALTSDEKQEIMRLRASETPPVKWVRIANHLRMPWYIVYSYGRHIEKIRRDEVRSHLAGLDAKEQVDLKETCMFIKRKVLSEMAKRVRNPGVAKEVPANDLSTILKAVEDQYQSIVRLEDEGKGGGFTFQTVLPVSGEEEKLVG